MTTRPPAVTAARFAQGMTFDQYLAFIASPQNLAREASMGGTRRDWSGWLRERYARAKLTDAQTAAILWLRGQAAGPRKVLIIAEEWSSDCRRDLPLVQRLAEAGGLELRIFARDGQRFSKSPAPEAAESPNADLMGQFLLHRGGTTFQAIPVVAFFGEDMQYLAHYIELPGAYHKDRLVGHLRAARPGESPEQTAKRGTEDFTRMLDSPMFDVWGTAAVSEMIAMLYERQVVGSLA